MGEALDPVETSVQAVILLSVLLLPKVIKRHGRENWELKGGDPVGWQKSQGT